MTILITGGAGFIGTNFIHLPMREREHRVVNFDLLTSTGFRENSAEFEGAGRSVALKECAVEAVVRRAVVEKS